MRIGLIGTESDHAVDFLRMLNAMERSPGDRIVAIWGEDADHDWPTWRTMLPVFLDKLV